MSTKPQDDVALVQAIAHADRAALAELYDRYVGRLFGLAVRLMGRPSDAEDLVHDLFIEVWHQAHRYDAARGSVQSWLILRLRSRGIDRLRSASYRRVVALDSAPRDSEPTLSADAVAAATEREPLHRALSESLSTLSDETRAILELVYFHDMSLPEVAAHMNLPLGTVKSRLHRSLRSLRATVGPLEDDAPHDGESTSAARPRPASPPQRTKP